MTTNLIDFLFRSLIGKKEKSFRQFFLSLITKIAEKQHKTEMQKSSKDKTTAHLPV